MENEWCVRPRPVHGVRRQPHPARPVLRLGLQHPEHARHGPPGAHQPRLGRPVPRLGLAAGVLRRRERRRRDGQEDRHGPVRAALQEPRRARRHLPVGPGARGLRRSRSSSTWSSRTTTRPRSAAPRSPRTRSRRASASRSASTRRRPTARTWPTPPPSCGRTAACASTTPGRTTARARTAARSAPRTRRCVPLGVTMEQISLDMNDTGTSPDSGGAGGSRCQVMVGNAIKDACEKLIEAMSKADGGYRTYDEMVAEGLDLRYEGSYTAEACTFIDPHTGQGEPNLNYMYARVPRRGVRGRWRPARPTSTTCSSAPTSASSTAASTSTARCGAASRRASASRSRRTSTTSRSTRR